MGGLQGATRERACVDVCLRVCVLAKMFHRITPSHESVPIPGQSLESPDLPLPKTGVEAEVGGL